MSSDSGKNLPNLLRRALPWTAVALGALLGLRRLAANDTWWHLAAGRWIVDHGSIPRTDTLSFTVPTHDWINLQWLFDVLAYLVHSIGGTELLVILAAAGYGVATWLLVANIRLSLGPLLTTGLAVWTLWVIQPRFMFRPEMMTFIFLGAVVYLLSTAKQNEGRRLWLLVPLMLLWVNFHALFGLGVFCIVCGIVSAFAARASGLPRTWRVSSDLGPHGTRRMLWAGGAALVVTLINPFFVRGVFFPIELMGRLQSETFQSIGEFRPPFSFSFLAVPSIGAYQAFFVFAVAAVGLATFLTASERTDRGDGESFDLAGVLIFAGVAYLSLKAQRNTGVLGIAAAPVVARSLRILIGRLPNSIATWQDRLRPGATVVTALALLATAWFVTSNRFYRWDHKTEEFGVGTFAANVPEHAVAFIEEIGLAPELYNDLTVGGYLTWTRPLDSGVYIDSRLEVYDAEFFSEYRESLGDFRRWQQAADERGVNTVVLYHGWSVYHSLIRELIRAPGWSMIYFDEVAVIASRIDGNNDRVRAALQAFPAWQKKTEARLDAPIFGWGYPVSRSESVIRYATLLEKIGYSNAAVRYYERSIELGVSRDREVAVRVGIATHYYNRGEHDEARVHIERALELEPDNARLQQMMSDLD